MLDAPVRPAILDRDRAILRPAEPAQSLHKSADPTVVEYRRVRAQEPDDRQFPNLLRTPYHRPRCHTLEPRDKLAPSHHPSSDHEDSIAHLAACRGAPLFA